MSSHSLLKRQLEQLGLHEDTPPANLEVWQQLLERVSRAYLAADQDRYLLERSLSVSFREMQEMHDNLQQLSATRLAEERDKLEAIITSLVDGLCTLDDSGRLLFMNARAEKLLGWKENELVGKSVLDIVEIRNRQEQPRTINKGTLQALFSSGEAYDTENGLFVRKDGITFPVAYSLNPILKDKSLSGAVLVFRDITQRKRIEAELNRYRKHLEEQVEARTAELMATNKKLHQEIIEHKQTGQKLALTRDQALAASRLKSELLARVSHELRTPLNAILGFSEMLVEGVYGEVSPEQVEILRLVVESTGDLTDLINELIAQANLEADRLKVKLSSFSPMELVMHIQGTMGPAARAKGLHLTTTIAPDMPSMVLGDLERLRQVLGHLLKNGIKFTKKGTVEVKIYRTAADQWACAVKDTGVGIPLEAQTYIFEPFLQVDGSVTREQGGVGLGLSIVKQLVELMGGEITLSSEAGQGSTFTVLLPLTPGAE
jgi:PAS domain S-box-containing protein